MLVCSICVYCKKIKMIKIMKKYICILCFLFCTNLMFAQNVISINTSIPVDCNGDLAEITITTDAVVNFNYQLQVQLPTGIWVDAGIVNSIFLPPNFTIPNLFAGTYRIILYNISNGISTDTSFSYTINQPLPIVLYATNISNVICNGGSDGEIELIASGGSPPLTYSWLNGLPNSPIVTGLSEGIYTCDIADTNGCSYSGNPMQINITEPLELTPAITSVPVSCNGGSDGSFTITTSGGTPGYTYSLDGGTTTTNPVFSGLSVGTYLCTVTDANGCFQNKLVTIEEPSQITANIVPTNVLCNGDATGSIIVSNVNGSNGPSYSFSWSNGSNDSINQNLYSGTYYLTISDNNGCTNIFTEIITEPAILSATMSFVNTSLNGLNDGNISANISGGTTPYLYSWSGPNSFSSSSSFINGLYAGIYILEITDGNGCQQTFTQTISEPNCNINIDSTYVPLVCFGDSAIFSWLNSSGLAPYENTLINSNGDTIVNEANYNYPPIPLQLPAGVYDLIVVDAAGCSAILNMPIESPDTIIINLSLTDVMCFGEDNGAVSLSVSGGVLPYNIDWGGVNQNQLIAGNYNVFVIDENGCNSEIVNYEIDEPDQLQIDSVVTSMVSCNPGNDGTATLFATGGTLPYFYLWSNTTTSQSAQNLISGIYNVTIYDDNLCTANSIGIQISNAPQLDITISETEISCYNNNDGTLAVNLVNGTSPLIYTWYNDLNPNVIISSDSVVLNLTSGNYITMITDAYGCIDQDTFALINPSLINFTLASTNSTSSNGANDGWINVTALSGGQAPFSFNWVGPNSFSSSLQNIINLSPGTYSLTITDSNGCSTSQSSIINEYFCDISIDLAIVQPICFGGNGTITWLNLGGNGSPPIYTNLITDLNSSDTLFYSFGDSSSIPLSIGSYSLQVSDQYGCTIIDLINIIEPTSALSIANIYIVNNISCNGYNDGAITVDVTGGVGAFIYEWDDINYQTTQLAIGLTADTFSVTVTDSVLCSVSSTIVVIEPPVIVINSSVTDISCFNISDGIINSMTSGGTSPYVLSWVGPNNYSSNLDTIYDLGNGIYTLTITDGNSCIHDSMFIITDPTPLSIDLLVIHPLCYNDWNGTIQLGINGGIQPYSASYYSGNISFPSPDSILISGLSAGSDSLYITDNNGCVEARYISLINPIELEVNNLIITHPTCYDYADGSAIISATGGIIPYTYQVLDNENNIMGITSVTNGLQYGSYNYIVTDSNNCSDNTLFLLNNPEEIEIIATIDHILCYGNNEGSIRVEILNANNYQLFWDNTFNDSIYIDELSSGIYNITIIDENNCTKIDSFYVNQNTEIILDYIIYDATCIDIEDGKLEISSIYGGQSPYDILINEDVYEDIESNLMIANLAATEDTLIVRVIDINNCVVNIEFMVDFIGGYDCIDVPVIVSPNSDDINDDWNPLDNIDTEIEITILNRWGETEYYYSGNSIAFNWNGLNTSGNKIPSADYYYIIDFKDNNYLDLTGVITLIR